MYETDQLRFRCRNKTLQQKVSKLKLCSLKDLTYKQDSAASSSFWRFHKSVYILHLCDARMLGQRAHVKIVIQ